MALLKLDKPPEYCEHDEAFVRRALKGRKSPEGLERSIKVRVIRCEDLVKKFVDDGNGVMHEVWVKESRTERYYPDHKSRKNWGSLYRACLRLEKSGWIRSFTLRHDGDLDVEWFTCYEKRIITPLPVNKYYSKYLTPSTVPPVEIASDKRKTYFVGIHFKKSDTTPKVPPDWVELRAEPRHFVEHRLKKQHEELHSEKARAERVRKMKDKGVPAYLFALNDKIKWSPFGTGIHQDVVHWEPRKYYSERKEEKAVS